MKYRKKPVIIEANQWHKNGDHWRDGVGMEAPDGQGGVYQRVEGLVVRFFRRPDVPGYTICKHCAKTMHEHGWIDTLEGGHIVCPGDWIITGVKGENYPCKPDIFEATYEAVREQVPSPEAMAFVRKKIAHQMARRTWSNQWSEDHIYDAARMLDDWMTQSAERR